MKLSKTEINTPFDVNLIKNLRCLDLSERFGMKLSEFEINEFLQKLEISNIQINLDFIKKLLNSVLSKIPFQNYKMIERGLGYIPREKDIKEDMLSLNGGTCATMNTFVGAILYKIGFDVSLINGTMIKTNDHIAILLKFENNYYTIDVGDGQPYFTPSLINTDKVIEHPFRTYRTLTKTNDLKIDFLIKGKWITDVTLHLTPKTFKDIYITIEQHYTQKEFGPFWNGVRFAIYPNNKIIAIRDNYFFVQKNNSIEKIKIKNHTHLTELTTEYLPDFIDQINLCFKTLKIL